MENTDACFIETKYDKEAFKKFIWSIRSKVSWVRNFRCDTWKCVTVLLPLTEVSLSDDKSIAWKRYKAVQCRSWYINADETSQMLTEKTLHEVFQYAVDGKIKINHAYQSLIDEKKT